MKVYETGSTEMTATRKNNYYFRDWDPDTTSTASDYPEINIKEGTTVSDTKRFWIPAVSESSITYDANGNLTGDALWSYTYDEENRLIQMTETSAAATAGFPDTTITFKYDYLARRVEKKVVRGTTTETHLRFVWRGWLLVAELNAASNNARVKTYTWGPDISGSFGGAGGNGGVLIFKDHTSTVNESFYPAYDAQGNVTGLIDTDGNLDAAYEYDPFGKLIRYAGTRSTSMSLLYGTKYLDMETGLIYYGYRYYDPRQGRFINRDPIGEAGGINLYGMVGNNPVNWVDYLGLCDSEGDIDPETDEEICEEDQIRIVIVGRTDNGDLIVVIDGRPEDVDRFRQQARDYVGEDRRSGLVWDGQFSDGTQLGWDGDSLVLRDENSSILSDFGVGESVLVAGNRNSGFNLIYAEVKFGDIEVLGYDDDTGRQHRPGTAGFIGSLNEEDVANALAGAGFPTIRKSRPGAFGSGRKTSPASIIARSSPLGKVNSPVNILTPTYSNLAARTKNLGIAAGRLGPLAGAVYATYDTATSNSPWRTGIGHTFGIIGGVLGATAGVAASTPTGWTSAPILGTGGAIGGSYIGQEIGLGFYDAGEALYRWIRGN